MLLRALVECTKCGLDLDGVWHVPDAETMDEVYDVPPALMVCPCGHEEQVEYPGWMHTNEA